MRFMNRVLFHLLSFSFALVMVRLFVFFFYKIQSCDVFFLFPKLALVIQDIS